MAVVRDPPAKRPISAGSRSSKPDGTQKYHDQRPAAESDSNTADASASRPHSAGSSLDGSARSSSRDGAADGDGFLRPLKTPREDLRRLARALVTQRVLSPQPNVGTMPPPQQTPSVPRTPGRRSSTRQRAEQTIATNTPASALMRFSARHQSVLNTGRTPGRTPVAGLWRTPSRMTPSIARTPHTLRAIKAQAAHTPRRHRLLKRTPQDQLRQLSRAIFQKYGPPAGTATVQVPDDQKITDRASRKLSPVTHKTTGIETAELAQRETSAGQMSPSAGKTSPSATVQTTSAVEFTQIAPEVVARTASATAAVQPSTVPEPSSPQSVRETAVLLPSEEEENILAVAVSQLHEGVQGTDDMQLPSLDETAAEQGQQQQQHEELSVQEQHEYDDVGIEQAIRLRPEDRVSLGLDRRSDRFSLPSLGGGDEKYDTSRSNFEIFDTSTLSASNINLEEAQDWQLNQEHLRKRSLSVPADPHVGEFTDTGQDDSFLADNAAFRDDFAIPSGPMQPTRISISHGRAMPNLNPITDYSRQERARHGAVPESLVRKTAKCFSGKTLQKATIEHIRDASDQFFEQLSQDLAVFSSHAGRRTIDLSDALQVMRRQRLLRRQEDLSSIAKRLLPREVSFPFMRPGLL